MEDLTPQQELDRKEALKKEFEQILSKHNLEELYLIQNLIQNILKKEIKLSETAIAEKDLNKY